MSLSDFFIDVKQLPQDGYGFVQLMFLGGCYGYLLMYASNLISDGSELLLLVPSLSGLVGSVVLPILGAVPDGCIVLFSGMGPDAQEQLNVGVGALAGSTIMLLTVPWFLSILGGRVNIDAKTQKLRYKAPKLIPDNNMSLTGTGVGLNKIVNATAYIMLFTSFTYLLLQVPGLFYLHASQEVISRGERNWAVLGAFCCALFFFGYLYQQYKISASPDTAQALVTEEFVRSAIASGKITLLGAMAKELSYMNFQSPRGAPGSAMNYGSIQGYNAVPTKDQDVAASIPDEAYQRLKRILKPFYKLYDNDNSGVLSVDELQQVFYDLGEKVNRSDLETIFAEFDKDKSGGIDFDEFVQGTLNYILTHHEAIRERNVLRTRSKSIEYDFEGDLAQAEGEAEEEGEEEVPEDIRDLSPEEQQKRIKFRSAWMMGLGTIIVLLISDPMVDVLSEIGARTGISAFYVAFVLAPLASNASELIASFNYAQKKTLPSISISLATLEGAAIMNNTFVLGIFMLLICTQDLAWEYFAETASILFVEIVIALYALKSQHTLLDGICILMLYPFSLLLVAGLEKMGWN